jgi:homoserine kinase
MLDPHAGHSTTMASASEPLSRTVTVSVPATSANLGPGFDCLGLALDLRNELLLRSSGSELTFEGSDTVYEFAVDGVDADKVPADRSNLAIEAAETLFRRLNRRLADVSMRMTNCIPVGSGLGSSSSAIIAGLVGANALLNNTMSADDLLQMAVHMEGHPDNVAPAMLGGLVLGVLPDETAGPPSLIVHRWEPPQLTAVIVLPEFNLLTSEARAVLPPTITRQDAIFNASRLGLLIHALTTNDSRQLRVAMGDRLHQTHRLKIIPGAAAAYQAAYEAGAQGVALSGAGPSLIALTTADPHAIAQSMVAAFADAGLASRVWILNPSPTGVTISVDIR